MHESEDNTGVPGSWRDEESGLLWSPNRGGGIGLALRLGVADHGLGLERP